MHLVPGHVRGYVSDYVTDYVTRFLCSLIMIMHDYVSLYCANISSIPSLVGGGGTDAVSL